MKHIWECRRTYLATLCILVLGTLAWFKGIDSTTAIATIAIGVAGANAYEKKKSDNLG